MKVCASCGVENPDGARFCLACGSSLVPSCPVCGAERPEGARFCPECGAPLTEEVPAPAGQERRLVTILFADVTGSTGLGERLDPERLQEVLATYFGAMREEIQAEGGTVEKFIGDAVMAAFGVPIAHEDDPSRALRAALRMRRRLVEVDRLLEQRYGVTLQIRTGVNTGEVLAATSPEPGEPMVTGDAVNVAARLEQAAEPGQIVVAERTARAARGFRFRELGERQLRGKGEPVSAVALEDEAPEPPERGVPGLRAPMVGRDQELTLLRTLYERSVAERRPNLVTIYGDPGVGKSRLVREFLAWAQTQRPAPSVAFGRCLPYGDGITYWPLAEILKQHAGVLDSDPTETVLGKIEVSCDAVLESDPAIDAVRACRALAYTAGLEFPNAPMGDREPRQIRAEMHMAWRSFFSARSISAPVIVVIEDIHWADGALLDLLDDVADRVLGPVLILCPARPEILDRHPSWGGGRRNFSSISLEPLTAADSDRLVRLLLTVDAMPDNVHRRILERAEGNPFFLEEIVRHLIDDGQIVREGDRWRASEAIGEVRIPDTVQAVLAARIDILAPEEKRALQRAAVVGRIFWPGPVRRLLNGDGERLLETLDHLVERELVLSRLGSAFSREPEFAFKHILTREVAYESLPRRERGHAHAAVAGWLEETAAERAREFVELLAYHYSEAYRGTREDPSTDAATLEPLRAKAFELLLGSSEEARRRFAVDKAVRLAEQASGLAAGPIERATALERVGVAAIADYRGDLAWRSLREAAELLLEHAPEDRRAIARVCGRAVETPTRWPGSMRIVVTEEEIERLLDLGFANVDQDEDSEELVRLLIGQAFGPFSAGQGREPSSEELERSVAAGERAAGMALRLGRVDLASAALDGTGSALLVLGLYGRDLEFTERRIGLAARIEDPWELGDIFGMGAWGHAYVGDFRRAREFGEEGSFRAADQASGIRIHNLSWSAFASFHLGDWDRVVDEILPTARTLLGERVEDPPYFAAQLFGSCAFILEARRDPDAAGMVELIERLAEVEHGRSMVLAGWLAWILARRGEREEAARILRRIDEIPSKVARPHTDAMWAAAMSDLGWFDELPTLLERSRAYAAEAGLSALPIQLDVVEGRGALAAGDLERAEELLSAARDAFRRSGARWEVARAELSLAEALAVERPQDARSLLDTAMAEFERVRSRLEIDRVTDLMGRLA